MFKEIRNILRGKSDKPAASNGRINDAKVDVSKLFKEKAEEFRKYWSNQGDLDYSPTSLKLLDKIIDSAYGTQFFGYNSSKSDYWRISNLAGLIGPYFGEVIVRNNRGKWINTPKGLSRRWKFCVDIDGNKLNVFHLVENRLVEGKSIFWVYESAIKMSKRKAS